MGQTFYVVGHDDVDEEMYVSEANILVSKLSKLFVGSSALKICYYILYHARVLYSSGVFCSII